MSTDMSIRPLPYGRVLGFSGPARSWLHATPTGGRQARGRGGKGSNDSVGCASAGSPADEGPRVPVFDERGETPCEYEVMHSISASASSTRVGDREGGEARDRELGLAGAKIGADAVIVPYQGPKKIPFVVGSRSGAPAYGPAQVKYEGWAVRWIPEPCKELRL